jgi:hypothetical protein
MSAAPDPVRLARALNDAGARYLVIGGFAVIAQQYVRATEAPNEVELAGVAHLRLDTSAGPVDLVREGDPPLDFDSGFEGRLDVELDGVRIPVAGLPLLTALKRLADRPQDRVDLEQLERIHGPLPSL